jgi:hypothetical protein
VQSGVGLVWLRNKVSYFEGKIFNESEDKSSGKYQPMRDKVSGKWRLLYKVKFIHYMSRSPNRVKVMKLKL